MEKALRASEIIDRLVERFGEKIAVFIPPVGHARTGGLVATPAEERMQAVVDRDHVLAVLAHLREDAELRFDFLVDVTVIDHLLLPIPEIGERFAAVYQLRSLALGHRFTLKARVPESDPRVPSAFGLWKSALWAEREAHDMYGVEFEGNPDMRRLLMPEDYPGFPLRKDYPLRGEGERDAFPKLRNVEPDSALSPAGATTTAPGSSAPATQASSAQGAAGTGTTGANARDGGLA